MIELRPVMFLIGMLLTVLAGSMLVPVLVDLAQANPDWQVFAVSAAMTLFVGVALVLTNRGQDLSMGPRQAYVFTTLSWVVIAAFAALPFAFSELEMSYTDSFFESMSGLTTTGSTVITGLAAAPPGILIWRALLQWLGGIGIIVLALSILPMLRVGGMQLFRLESTDTSEKAVPQVAQLAAAIGAIYFGLTALCVFFYLVAGMGEFDAVAHAMTTVATGGFSTSDGSLGAFSSGAQWVAIVFMLSGALPFVLYLRALRGKVGALLRDSQVRAFLGIVAAVIAGLMLYRVLLQSDGTPALDALREVAFNVVSVITGTGFATADYGLWGPFPLTVFFFLMFVGGCAGSTSCGVKVFRLQVLYATTKVHFARLLHPSGVFVPYFNRRPIPESVPESVLSFFFLYVACFVGVAMGLGLMGLDFLTALSSAGTAISNVGPGLGPSVGPAGTFAEVPDGAKWLLSFAMLLGRLELLTVLMLFVPRFWRG